MNDAKREDERYGLPKTHIACFLSSDGVQKWLDEFDVLEHESIQLAGGDGYGQSLWVKAYGTRPGT